MLGGYGICMELRVLRRIQASVRANQVAVPPEWIDARSRPEVTSSGQSQR